MTVCMYRDIHTLQPYIMCYFINRLNVIFVSDQLNAQILVL